jgi:hypothetical protein
MLDPRTGTVHVANELRRPFRGAVVDVRVDGRAWSFGGDLPADSLTYIGRVEVSPETTSAEVTLTQPEVGCVHNTYGPRLLRACLGPPAAG